MYRSSRSGRRSYFGCCCRWHRFGIDWYHLTDCFCIEKCPESGIHVNVVTSVVSGIHVGPTKAVFWVRCDRDRRGVDAFPRCGVGRIWRSEIKAARITTTSPHMEGVKLKIRANVIQHAFFICKV